jgi:hypothetical protein
MDISYKDDVTVILLLGVSFMHMIHIYEDYAEVGCVKALKAVIR